MTAVSHLAKAASLYRGTVVGRGLLHSLRTQLQTQDLAVPLTDTEITEALGLCRHCSEMMVAGLNCTVTIAKSRKKGKRNCIKYRCMVCEGVTVLQAAASRQVPRKRDKGKEKTKTPTAPVSLLQQQRIAAGIPSSFRTLESKPSIETVMSSFFATGATGPNIYSLFH